MSGSGHSLEGQPLADTEVPPVFMMKQISPGYFDAMGIGLVEGRDFDRLDEEHGAPVVIVTHNLARTCWPGESALGKGIRQGGPPEDGQEWFRIVGVVDDVREITLHDPATELVYYPLARQAGDDLSVPLGMSFVVRADDTDLLANPVRAAVRAFDPHLPISDVNTMDALVTRARAQRAFVMVLLVIASGFALLLGGVGLYSVISYVVARRQREIAIRMAVGAELSDIRRLVLTEAAWMGVLGIAVGIGSALLMTGRLQTLLFETNALDPVVFLGVSTLLAGICLLASWLPARRAARIEPVTALRAE